MLSGLGRVSLDAMVLLGLAAEGSRTPNDVGSVCCCQSECDQLHPGRRQPIYSPLQRHLVCPPDHRASVVSLFVAWCVPVVVGRSSLVTAPLVASRVRAGHIVEPRAGQPSGGEDADTNRRHSDQYATRSSGVALERRCAHRCILARRTRSVVGAL